jgi:membrane-bound serine protease (ClpP class)
MPLWGSFVLIAVGILAIFVEVFVPAAGLIGIAGGGSIIAAVVLAYANHTGLEAGLVLATAVVVTPTALILGFRVFPKTFMGKRLILGSQEEPAAGAASYDKSLYQDIVGMEGEALTELRPSGTARIANRRLSVVTRGEFVARHSPIRVVTVEGNRIVVRRVASVEKESKS